MKEELLELYSKYLYAIYMRGQNGEYLPENINSLLLSSYREKVIKEYEKVSDNLC